MTTITDVANRAGVSVSTVSQVLNGNRPTSQRTKEKVLAIIKELGYVPNPNARALKSEKNGTIGFLASNINEPYIVQLIHGIEKVSRKERASLTFAAGSRFNYNIQDAVEYLTQRRVDGIIISTEFTGENQLEKDLPLNVPIVSVNRILQDSIQSIMPDNKRGGYLAAKHLIEQGCKKLAIIMGSEDRFAGEQRKAGFQSYLQEVSKELSPESICNADFTPDGGKIGLTKLLESNPGIDGIFCGNDYIAAGVLNGLQKLNIPCPDQIKIIGYDNRDFTSFWPIPITTFTHSLDEIGRLSARLLFDIINNRNIQKGLIYVEPRLIPRLSTKIT